MEVLNHSSTMELVPVNEEQCTSPTEEVIKSVYLNDLLMSNIIQFVPHENRENIELTSQRMYNISRKTPCAAGDDLCLYIRIIEEEPREDFLVCLQIVVDYTLSCEFYDVIERTGTKCYREQFEYVLQLFSRRFKKNITMVSVHFKVDAEMLQLLDKYFKHATNMYCHSFDESCFDFLQSPRQTTSRRIKQLELEYFDIEKDAPILASFKNLKELCLNTYENMEKPMFKLLETLDSLTDNAVKKKTMKAFGSVNKLLPHINFYLAAFYSSSLQKSLISIANLSKLSISFEGFTVSNAVSFFKTIKIHKLKIVNIFDVEYNEELINVLTPPEGKSELAELLIDRWMRVDNSEILLSTIVPKTAKCLYFVGDLKCKDLDIIRERCPLLEYFCFYPEFNSEDVNLENYVIPFQRAVLQMKNLKLFWTSLNLQPDFLVYLWKSETKLKSVKFLLSGVNDDIFEELYEKLHKKKPVVIRDEGASHVNYAVHPTFPLEYEDRCNIDFTTILKNPWLKFFQDLNSPCIVL